MTLPKRLFASLISWGTRYHLGKKGILLLVIGAMISVIATYVMMTNAPPFLKNKGFLATLFILDLLFFLTLVAVVAKHLVALWAERRNDQAGSKLHGRMIANFSLLAIAPTVIVAVFSAFFFNVVIQSWFNKRVETAIGESIAVAGAYLGEHQKVIAANAQAMAVELAPYVEYAFPDEVTLGEKLTDETELRSLDEAIVFNSRMQVLGRSRFSLALDFEVAPTLLDLENAKNAPVIYKNESNDRVRALIALNPSTNTYLLVGRHVSSTVLSRIENLEKAVGEYQKLEEQGSSIALKFAGVFIGMALMLLLAAVLGGIYFANKLVRPIQHLIRASDEVCKGNLSVRIKEEEESDELSSLTKAFNRMTSQLESQRDALVFANEEVDERRRFTEVVLAGVSAGVIGLDDKARISLPNESASELLDIDLKKKVGKKLADVVPEMSSLIEDIQGKNVDFIEKQIFLSREGHAYTFFVRLSITFARNKIIGYVLTFDDITQLQAAQRKAAWADVARRIAHEIKNPLTPIQLSAERLKRRYSKQISEDPQTFQNCVDTIVRQVGHIGQMVGEFSSFARLPVPNIMEEDIVQICRDEIFLQQQGNSTISIQLHSPKESFFFPCDRGQIGQVLTNLIQNACDSITSSNVPQGQVEVSLEFKKNGFNLKVSDNGGGLPPEGRERLTEPYVTFREKGTGLGLAIVKKIVEDHGGHLSFHDRKGSGAIVQISFSQMNKVSYGNE